MVERVRPGVVRVQTSGGSGSGVIYSTAPGGKALVLTNHHVIEGSATPVVVVGDATTYTSTIRGFDPLRDLAVLEICCGEFTVVPLGSAEDLAAGTEIVVMGYALGIAGEATVTRGIVSALRYEEDNRRWVIQTDAPINPGNSGGPMLSPTGGLVGIATYKTLSRGGIDVEGVGYAVAEATLRAQLPTLMSGQALASPTPTPRPPTPTPSPARYTLTVNGITVDGSIILMTGGQIKISPPPDADGSYAANSTVNLTGYNNDPQAGGAWYGVDSLTPGGVATVIMSSDRSPRLVFY